MNVDEHALYQAERWFRAKLRGETLLLEHEAGLFSAMAERQNVKGDFYNPRESPAQRYIDPFADTLPTTLPPPSSGAQRDWIQMSKASLPPKI